MIDLQFWRCQSTYETREDGVKRCQRKRRHSMGPPSSSADQHTHRKNVNGSVLFPRYRMWGWPGLPTDA